MIKVHFSCRLVSFVPASILRTNACDFYTCGVIGSVNKLTGLSEKNCLHKPARPQQQPRLSTLSGARDVTRPHSLSTLPFKSLTSFTGEKMAATKTAILLLADGAEEMEAVITADVLRRAGIDVTLASITGNESVKCSRNVTIVADAKFESSIKDRKYDVVILPGGLVGSKALAKSAEVGALLKTQEKENGMIAAICAAPTALKAHGIAKGKRITSYPSMKDQLSEDYEYLSEKVVIDGNLITSQGPATAYNFGLAIAEKLLNKETALKVASGLLFQDYK